MLRALKEIADQAKAHDTPATICGAMAADPLQAMVLIGLGYNALSMPASGLGPVKAMLRSLDAAAIREAVSGWLM
jgi:phosphotransferase system enzyme I (PtsP)